MLQFTVLAPDVDTGTLTVLLDKLQVGKDVVETPDGPVAGVSVKLNEPAAVQPPYGVIVTG